MMSNPLGRAHNEAVEAFAVSVMGLDEEFIKKVRRGVPRMKLRHPSEYSFRLPKELWILIWQGFVFPKVDWWCASEPSSGYHQR
ncbi:hypothetical protein GJ744_006611 [Endocarpon pusillum]|uniref:Uncharacterized protein n=1 Tax=Endocarpon pusillum TaxID=364733 RepID=A0A8H7AW42_9EURO|nr:hypothetical protein GJ744_006611 [Endocarpon pusillum]